MLGFVCRDLLCKVSRMGLGVLRRANGEEKQLKLIPGLFSARKWFLQMSLTIVFE